jgi:hypothetical protein
MAGISKVVRDRVRARLADPVAGFNAALAAACTAFGIQPAPNSIDFTDPKSKNFFQGMLSPDALDQTAPRTYPIVVIYSVGSGNGQAEKFRRFAGTVTFGLDVHLSWRKGNAIADSETLGDAVEEAVLNVFNSPDWTDAYTDPIAYNGEITLTRRPLEMAGEHWRQSHVFRLIFEVSTN